MSASFGDQANRHQEQCQQQWTGTKETGRLRTRSLASHVLGFGLYDFGLAFEFPPERWRTAPVSLRESAYDKIL